MECMEQIWWEKVPNALRYVSDIVNCILNEKSIVLSCSLQFPWYSHMVTAIKELVERQNSSKRFESASDIQNPGEYLLRSFCKPAKRAEYRPSRSYAKFFADSDDIVLHERYFWIKVTSKEQLDSWMDFISEYIRECRKNNKRAVFVLEWYGCEKLHAKRGMKICSFDEYINEYDKIVFCTLASSSVGERPFIKNYLTELASNVVGNDIELCAACIGNYREFLNNPYATVCNLVHNQLRSDGTQYTYDKNEDDVNHLIWIAQVRTVYPALEEFREDFVQRHSSIINENLPIETSYGETYEEPKDVELGTLMYLADNEMLCLSTKEYELLKTNKVARNKLSHLISLSLEEIRNIGA